MITTRSTILLTIMLAVACGGDGAHDDAVRAEFRQLDARLREGDNLFFGTAPVAELRRQLADESLEDWDRFPLLLRLAERQTQLGLLGDATGHLDEAVGLIGEPAASTPADSKMREALAAAHMLRAIAYLRVPAPTATTLPSIGFSLAESGMMIPPRRCSFSSIRLTSTRS